MAPATQTIATQFARDGYYVTDQLFTVTEVQQWKAECRRVLDAETAAALDRDAPRPQFWNTGVYVGLSVASPLCRAFARDPRLLDALEPVIGPNITFWSDKIVFKAEETTTSTPWHQDWPYWEGCHKINAWIALDDATPANGCLKLVRGSHRAALSHDAKAPAGEGFTNRVDSGKIDDSLVVSAPAPAGAVVVFHDLTLHASHPNTAHTDRWAVIATYKDAQAEDKDYPFAKAAAVVRGTGRAGARA
ncbi:MAG: phytanoyl-CoA dioxygenase family protein [Chloroflexota bacterium]